MNFLGFLKLATMVFANLVWADSQNRASYFVVNHWFSHSKECNNYLEEIRGRFEIISKIQKVTAFCSSNLNQKFAVVISNEQNLSLMRSYEYDEVAHLTLVQEEQRQGTRWVYSPHLDRLLEESYTYTVKVPTKLSVENTLDACKNALAKRIQEADVKDKDLFANCAVGTDDLYHFQINTLEVPRP